MSIRSPEKSPLAKLIEIVPREKNIPAEVLIDVVERAMEKAAKQHFGTEREFHAEYIPEMGEVEVYERKTVVEEVEEPLTEVALSEARSYDENFEVGDVMDTKMNVLNLGRIAAQTAKQFIIQRIRDAEREMTFNEFKDRKGDLLNGIVRRFEKGNIIVDLGLTEAILPKREQVPNETYRVGDTIHAYVLDINRSAKLPQVVLSRTHKLLLMKLFELEVPEIYEGIVQIEACARVPGHRAKIAVSTNDESVDPVGACVGLRGSRVQAVVQELRGEAIDIIPFNDDPTRFVIDAIAPANVSKFILDSQNNCIELIVPDDQLSKAIGRHGQNVRLAAQLTGWRIDIFSESRHEEINSKARSELSRVDGLDEEDIGILIRNGYLSLEKFFDATEEEIAMILDIEDDHAKALIENADKAIVSMQEEEKDLPEEEQKDQSEEEQKDLPEEEQKDLPEEEEIPSEV
jgi:transcription termination/antitermination protein NusA